MDKKGGSHPVLVHRWNVAERTADKLTTWMGSWSFILIFISFLLMWIIINAYFFIRYELGQPWDPYPFILLNLVLSSLAAIQAPIILMSQNRVSQKDRLRAEYDYRVNRKAEREVQKIMDDITALKKMIAKSK